MTPRRPLPARLATATLGVTAVAFAAGGCGRSPERPWALEQSPPAADSATGDGAPARVRLEAGHHEAIREVAATLAGGVEAWDGRVRLESGRLRWSDVPAAVAAAGDREGIECVVSEVLADGRDGRWSFRLLTSDREPGRIVIDRDPDDGAITVREASLGRRPDAGAMRRRASRLTEAFAEELARLAERPRFAEVEDAGD